MRNQVDQYEWNCHSCQWSRTSRHVTFGVFRPLPVPERLWEDISMDVVVGLPEYEGFDAVCVVVDMLLKMRHFIPCHTTIDAVGLARLFLRDVVRVHRLPKTIVSDWGPRFASTFWGQICYWLTIYPRMSTAFHPQTDDQTEQINARMEQYLRVFVNHQQDDWVQCLHLLCLPQILACLSRWSVLHFCSSGCRSTNVVCRRANTRAGSMSFGCWLSSSYDAASSWRLAGWDETKSSPTGGGGK